MVVGLLQTIPEYRFCHHLSIQGLMQLDLHQFLQYIS